jgi:anti-sigma regulatory factor (Ser/Thr protein kinase)
MPVSAASDAALIVSELVTNSVLHANVGVHQALNLELAWLDDRIRIAVTDPGSELEPRLLTADPTRLGGLGLQLVDKLAMAWGVVQTASETRVWCDLPVPRVR